MNWETIPEMVLSAADRFGDAEAVDPVQTPLEVEDDRGQVLRRPRARRRDEDRVRVLPGDTSRRVLELEAVSDDQVIALRPVLPELLLEFRGRLGLRFGRGTGVRHRGARGFQSLRH